MSQMTLGGLSISYRMSLSTAILSGILFPIIGYFFIIHKIRLF
jgi:hypothetical protein